MWSLIYAEDRPLVVQWEHWHSLHKHCTWVSPGSLGTAEVEPGGADWCGDPHHSLLHSSDSTPALCSDCEPPGYGSYLHQHRGQNVDSYKTHNTVYEFKFSKAWKKLLLLFQQGQQIISDWSLHSLQLKPHLHGIEWWAQSSKHTVIQIMTDVWWVNRVRISTRWTIPLGICMN